MWWLKFVFAVALSVLFWIMLEVYVKLPEGHEIAHYIAGFIAWVSACIVGYMAGRLG